MFLLCARGCLHTAAGSRLLEGSAPLFRRKALFPGCDVMPAAHPPSTSPKLGAELVYAAKVAGTAGISDLFAELVVSGPEVLLAETPQVFAYVLSCCFVSSGADRSRCLVEGRLSRRRLRSSDKCFHGGGSFLAGNTSNTVDGFN
jgi:hypothetical protein